MQKRYFTLTNANNIKNVKADFVNAWYEFEWPSEFWTSNNQKEVRIISFTYIKTTTIDLITSSNVDVGTMLHSDFNQETNEMDRFVALSNFGSGNEKTFTIFNGEQKNRIWFRDYDGSTLFPTTEAHYFIIQMELFY